MSIRSYIEKSRLIIITTIIIVGLFSFTKCKTGIIPGSSLNEVEFSIFPHIIKKNEEYYLQYQIKVSEGYAPSLVRVLYSKKIGEKAYYFFSIPISHYERGTIVERPLKMDGFKEFAEKSSVYWLNKDNSEIKLEIKENE